MTIRILVAVLLLFALLSCAGPGPGMQEEPVKSEGNPLYAHSRQSENWRHFDEQLERLYTARMLMRETFRLKDKPAIENSIHEAAWKAMQAVEQSTMAYMVSQETMNDLEHCRQAIRIAEEEVESAREKSSAARESMTTAMQALEEEVLSGDAEANLEILESYSAETSKYYADKLMIIVNRLKKDQDG